MKRFKKLTALALTVIMLAGIILSMPMTVSASTVNLVDTMAPYQTAGGNLAHYPTSGSTSIAMGGIEYKNALAFWRGGARSQSFNLAGSYTKLTGVVGRIDTLSNRNATLNIYGDNKLILSQPVQTGLPVSFEVNVTGVRDLKIEANMQDYYNHMGLALLRISTDASAYVNPSYDKNLIDILPPYQTEGGNLAHYPTTGWDNITLGGIEYKNALAFWRGGARSQSFRLDGKHTALTGIIGRIDTLSDKNVTVNFYGDGRLLSAVAVEVGLPVPFNVSLAGVTELKIETNMQDYYNHAAIAQLTLDGGSVPVIQTPTQTPLPAPTTAPSSPQNLIDILPPYQSEGGNLAHYTSIGNDSVTMGGREYKNALAFWRGGARSQSFNLAGNYTKLTGIVGRVDTLSERKAVFNIYGDGRLILSRPVQTGLPVSFEVNVTGVRDLKIETNMQDYYNHMGFAELRISAETMGAASFPYERNLVDVLPPYQAENGNSAYYITTGWESVTLGGNEHKNSLAFWRGGKRSQSFNLAGSYTKLTGIVGRIDTLSARSVTVNFYGDGRLLHTMPIAVGLPVSFEVNLTGVKNFKIESDMQDYYNHVALAQLVFDGGGTVAPPPTPPPVEPPTPPPVDPPPEMPPPPVVPIEPVPPIGILPFTAVAVETGVKLEWQPIAGAIGYRIYRSTTSGVEGITITDFPIAGVFQLDFNVDESTTYYYGLRPLLREASLTELTEQLGDIIWALPVTTFATLIRPDLPGGNVTQNTIIMVIGNPMMTVNGEQQ